MPHPGLTSPDLASTLATLAPFATEGSRADAAAALARELGGEDLVIFTPDPELRVMLPAPGLPQPLSDATAWRAFIAACAENGTHRGELPARDGSMTPALGCAVGDAVVVLTGTRAPDADLSRVFPLFIMLAALFTAERRTDVAETRAAAAAESLEILNSEREAANHEAHKAQAAADAANRAKSQFLANMSHELRTPINAIVGYTELLTMGVSGPVNKDQLAHLERVRASSKHLLMLIDDVLDLANVEAGQMSVALKSGMVATAVNDAIALVAIQASERGITLMDECSEKLARYVGDELRVRQILTNLLSNAVKFTEPGGRITLRCGTGETPPDGGHVTGAGPWTFIEVEDTGVGIAEQEIAQIFRPFVQAEMGRHRMHGGTGLGLTISRQLARLMGGDLSAASQLGQGSRFTLWLASEHAEPGEIDDSIRV